MSPEHVLGLILCFENMNPEENNNKQNQETGQNAHTKGDKISKIKTSRAMVLITLSLVTIFALLGISYFAVKLVKEAQPGPSAVAPSIKQPIKEISTPPIPFTPPTSPDVIMPPQIPTNTYTEPNIASLDSDQDGLSDEEEEKYGTDPNNPDTDGDGYTDGQEVDSGFGPLSPPSQLLIIDPSLPEVEIKQNRYILSGTNYNTISRIRVLYKNKILHLEDDYYLTKFKPGDTEWQYTADKRYGNLDLGENEYIVIAYGEIEEELGRASVIITVTDLPGEAELVAVDWLGELKLIESAKYDSGIDQYGDLYLAGTITSGTYKSKDLYILAQGNPGGHDFNHLIKIDDSYESIRDLNLYIGELEDLPEKITYPDTNYALTKGWGPSHLLSEYFVERTLFNDNTLGPVYLTCDNSEEGQTACEGFSCISVELADHTMVTYNFEFPFINEEGIVDFTLINGDKSSEVYTYTKMIGCGVACSSLDILSKEELELEIRLKKAGESAAGEIFYEFKDSNDELYQELYNREYTRAWYSDSYSKQEESRYTYEEFLAMHPLLFWEDPIGRWLRFTNRKYDSMAEMCKPVIYLYPEHPITVTVQVNPNGGFTYTEPLYRDEWQVYARPDGKLHLADGSEYDYLFWEGIGLGLEPPQDGFAVKREELETFFTEKLSKLSFNEQEIADFKDYWVARLQGSEYWLIAFMDEKIFNEIASLDVKPHPDTIIRVFITATALDAPVDLPAPEIIGKKRQGFTVVEWGGAVFE